VADENLAPKAAGARRGIIGPAQSLSNAEKYFRGGDTSSPVPERASKNSDKNGYEPQMNTD